MRNSVALLLMGLLVVAMSLTTGCATIVNGDMVSVPVYTTPPEAKISVAGQELRSPATAQIPRGKGDFKMTIEKEGYKTGYVLLTQSLDGWLWGNILLGGLIGLLVDFISGDAYDLEPELVNFDLVKGELIGAPPPEAKPEAPSSP